MLAVKKWAITTHAYYIRNYKTVIPLLFINIYICFIFKKKKFI